MIGRGYGTVARIVVLCGWSLSVAAQQAPPAGVSPPSGSDASVSQEVARLNGTLKELVTLLRQQVGGQRIELLMRQVEIKRGKLAPIESQVLMARSTKEMAEMELRNLQMSQEQAADEVVNSFGGGDGSLEQQEQMEKMAEQMTRHYATQLKLAKERIAELDQKIQVLESEASTARVEVEHWEAMVERELQR